MRISELIWVGSEAKYFCKRGLTRFLKTRSDLPVGHNQLDQVQTKIKISRKQRCAAARPRQRWLWSPDQSAIMRLHRLVAIASCVPQAFDVRNLNIAPIASHWNRPSKSRAGKVRHAAARSMTSCRPDRGSKRRRSARGGAQERALHLPPWQVAPCNLYQDDLEGDPRRGGDAALALLQRMQRCGVSKWHPDPAGACEAAEGKGVGGCPL